MRAAILLKSRNMAHDALLTAVWASAAMRCCLIWAVAKARWGRHLCPQQPSLPIDTNPAEN